MNFVTLFATALLFCSSPVHAYIEGYARLGKLGGETTIDILYDLHESHPQKGMFPSEKKFAAILTTLNKSSKGVDLVWEWDNIRPPRDHTFISSYPPHIIKNLRNITFISADTCRLSGYAGLFNWKGYRFKNRAGSSLAEPVPFGPKRRRQLLVRAGKSVYDNYVALYSQTVSKLNTYFACRRKTRLDYTRDFWENDTYHAIADLEMLYHILVSEKERIIVYCGGWHSYNIATFLIDNGYLTVKASGALSEAEVCPHDLEFMHRG
jgi:hypothetical protein